MSSHQASLSKLFPTCPLTHNRILPFAIDEMVFSEWLSTLVELDNIAKCQKILEVLQILNNFISLEDRYIPGRTRLFFLEKLNSVLTPATAMLNSSSEVSADEALVDDEIARSEISVWATLELANAFWLLSQDDWFKEPKSCTLAEQTSIINDGIQAMGKGLLYISQTYTNPPLYFWHRCFQFYRFASTCSLTNNDFNPDARVIDNAFKRILVFYLSTTNQFTPHEMRTIYELLGQYAAHAKLLISIPKKKFGGIPSINLKGNEPPIVVNDYSDKLDPDRLYIATVTVASNILEATYDRRARILPTDRLMFLRLAKTLTHNEQRKDARTAIKANYLGTVGFDNIVEYLRGKESEKESILNALGSVDMNKPKDLHDLDLEILPKGTKKTNNIEDFYDTDNLKLATLADPLSFQVVEFTDPAEIWQNSQQDYHEGNMRLVDKSEKGYGLLWTDNQIKPKVGGIIGIMHKTMTIGLVRWLAQSKETGMFMGVELLGTNAATIQVSNPGYPYQLEYAILLPSTDNIKQAADLIFLNKTFQPNEFVFLHKSYKNVRYRITKQQHLTALINHVEVVLSH